MVNKGRLDKLMEERQTRRRGQRCEHCKDWGNRFVSDHMLHSGKPLANDLPKACPVCGHEPTTIRISLTENWRGDRALHTTE